MVLLGHDVSPIEFLNVARLTFLIKWKIAMCIAHLFLEDKMASTGGDVTRTVIRFCVWLGNPPTDTFIMIWCSNVKLLCS